MSCRHIQSYCKFEDWIIPKLDQMLQEQNTQLYRVWGRRLIMKVHKDWLYGASSCIDGSRIKYYAREKNKCGGNECCGGFNIFKHYLFTKQPRDLVERDTT